MRFICYVSSWTRVLIHTLREFQRSFRKLMYGHHVSSRVAAVFYFGTPQAVDKDEEAGGLFTTSFRDLDLQKKELGEFLLNNVAVS